MLRCAQQLQEVPSAETADSISWEYSPGFLLPGFWAGVGAAGDAVLISVFCIRPDVAGLASRGTPGLQDLAEFIVDRGVLSFQSNSLSALSHYLPSPALWQCSLPCSSCCLLHPHSHCGCQQRLPIVPRMQGRCPHSVASIISSGSHILGSCPRVPSHGLCAWKPPRALVSPDDSSCWWKLLG